MHNAVKLRRLNKEDWQRAEWVSDMVQAIGSDAFFRWFDSGDVYSVGLARKIKSVVELTPHTQHWIPTRSWKFPKILRVLRDIAALPNVAVRWSSDSINGALIPDAPCQSTVTATHDEGVGVVCEAYERGGKCGDCRACWSASNSVITYVAHGRVMNKQYDIIAKEAA